MLEIDKNVLFILDDDNDDKKHHHHHKHHHHGHHHHHEHHHHDHQCKFKTEVIRLKPGQKATRKCGVFPGKTITVKLSCGEVLVAVCKSSRRIFIFVCGKPCVKRRIFLRRGTKIVVSCHKVVC